MAQFPLATLEDLMLASLNPRAIRERCGLPHPLQKFAANGAVKEGPYADAIIGFIHDSTLAELGSERYRAAIWFLFESKKAFFRARSHAGINAIKLRRQLKACIVQELQRIN